jgi:hypothetical protein
MVEGAMDRAKESLALRAIGGIGQAGHAVVEALIGPGVEPRHQGPGGSALAVRPRRQSSHGRQNGFEVSPSTSARPSPISCSM